MVAGPDKVTDDIALGSEDELLCLDNQLCFPLYAASKELVRAYVPLLRELDLTYTQYIAMMVLWEQGQTSVNELGERLYLDSGTLTPMLKKLEAKGYVERARDEHDGRRLVVRLTGQGRDLKHRAATVPMAMGSCLGLDLKQANQLRDILNTILDNLGKANGND